MTVCSTCKHSNYCEIVSGGYSSQVKSCRDYRKREPMTNEEWLRSATFEELAGAIYEWHSAGYTKGKLGKKLNPITEIVGWLKEQHQCTDDTDK